jgi:DNA replication protein DnaC
VIAPDGGAGTARECDCRRRHRAGRLVAAAGIPEGYRNKKLGTFNTTGTDDPNVRAVMLRARRESETYVEQFRGTDGVFVAHGLLYSGPAGCGKTHLAAGVLIELIQRYQVRGRFVNLTSLVQQLQSTFDGSSSSTRQELLGPILEAQVVVLDELGSQKPSEWVQDLLYYLIDTRYAARRPTLFTTNCSLAGSGQRPARAEENLDRGADLTSGRSPLARRIDASLVSRLFEMARWISMDAVPDFRLEVRDRGLGRTLAARR